MSDLRTAAINAIDDLLEKDDGMDSMELAKAMFARGAGWQRERDAKLFEECNEPESAEMIRAQT